MFHKTNIIYLQLNESLYLYNETSKSIDFFKLSDPKYDGIYALYRK